MTPGTVLFDTQFEFEDGTIGRKLLVLLNDGSCGFYVVLKTTSNPKYKSRNSGCQSKDRYPNFFVPDKTTCLIGDSFLMLKKLYEVTAPALLQKKFSGFAKHIGVLPKDLVIDLLECALGSKDITGVQSQVLKATLEQLREPEPPPLELVKPQSG